MRWEKLAMLLPCLLWKLLTVSITLNIKIALFIKVALFVVHFSN